MLKRELNTLEVKKYRTRSDLAISLLIGNNKKFGKKSGSLARILNNIAQNLTKDIAKKYEMVFGKNPTWRDWVINGSRAEDMINQKLVKSSAYKGYRKKLSNFLKQAWKERYKEIIDKYSAQVGGYKADSPYGPHYVRKKRAKDGNLYGGSWQKSAPASNGVKYVSPGLMTGYLRQSISSAISDAVNGAKDGPMEFSNSPLQIASISNIEDGKSDEFKNGYYFWNRVVKGSKGYGGVSDFRRQRMFALNASQMRDASAIMTDAVVKDFLPELKNILSELKVKV